MYATAEDKLTAIGHLIQSGGQVLSASDVIDKISAIIDPQPANAERANPVHCVLCLNGKGARVAATQVVDGYSFCEDCARDVTSVEPAPYVCRYPDNRFALHATVDRLRQRPRAV